jgi:hypothetical protein
MVTLQHGDKKAKRAGKDGKTVIIADDNIMWPRHVSENKK